MYPGVIVCALEGGKFSHHILSFVLCELLKYAVLGWWFFSCRLRTLKIGFTSPVAQRSLHCDHLFREEPLVLPLDMVQ
jgi:hypothetical protein